jgi:uncharacterized repeat protein (TIGR03803 family)
MGTLINYWLTHWKLGKDFIMRRERLSIGFGTTLAIFAMGLLVTSAWAASQKVLHSFGNGADGAEPLASLIFDAQGNLYGTTYQGGSSRNCPQGCGTVFKLTPQSGGGWTEKVLYNFVDRPDGSHPTGRLIFDAHGNLYGTTYLGGQGCGTVFKIDTSNRETVLYSFCSGGDGLYPAAGLIQDSAGNLYGTTSRGGPSGNCDLGCGTVFELLPTEGGGWTEKVLYTFDGTDGADPQGDLIFDAAGNLYATTTFGGPSSSCSATGGTGCGTVFKLTPTESGDWTETVLHRFDHNGTDGFFPLSDVIFDVNGNLYGTTNYGGSGNCDLGCGTVFKLTPQSGGGWTETVLHSFGINGTDGAGPAAGVIFDAGSLYGTTIAGGYGHGTVFELTPTAGGNWTEKVVYNFGRRPIDGSAPEASVIFDAHGNLYGTTGAGGGGANGGGTAFEIPGDTTTKPWTQLATWEGTLVNDLAFPTADIGFAAGQLGQVWKTTDGGSHWTPVMSLGSPYYWYGIAALNTNDVVVSGHDNGGMALLRWSHDGGSSWGPIINLGPYQLFRVRFADSKNGLALDDAGNVFYTTNGGETGSDWTRSKAETDFLGIQFSLLPLPNILPVRAAGANFCAGFLGFPLVCGPPIDKPSDDAVFFVDLNHGWVGGGEAGPEKPTGWVQFTTNGALTWSGPTLSSPWPVQEIRFVDRQNGWAAGGNAEVVGGIYSSKDGGKTWSLDFQNGYEMVSCAQATTPSRAVRVWCVGDTISGSALYAQTVPQ